MIKIELDGNLLTINSEARYENGLLQLLIPKKEKLSKNHPGQFALLSKRKSGQQNPLYNYGPC
jgi:hypothetical protein